MKRLLFVVSENCDHTLKTNLKKLGVLKEISCSKFLDVREGTHPDMRICRISENSCVISPDVKDDTKVCFEEHGIKYKVGVTNLSPKYPYNIAYNVSVGDKIFFHNTNHTDKILLNELFAAGKKAITVKQGYSGCSAIFAGDIVVTSDICIYNKALKENVRAILFREPKNIILDGFEHGFIGGCCGYSKETGLLINCSEELLPDEFRNDLELQNVDYKCVGTNRLTDVGGIVIFTVS